MNKAQFVFTKYHNSFRVHVKNLEKLSVEQIQEIQKFVRVRKGIFDFATYSFVIQKRLEFSDFVALVLSSNIKATCSENIIIQKQQPRVNFGQYKGMFFSELPDSYILWLKSNYRGNQRGIIEKEVTKRNL